MDAKLTAIELELEERRRDVEKGLKLIKWLTIEGDRLYKIHEANRLAENDDK